METMTRTEAIITGHPSAFNAQVPKRALDSTRKTEAAIGQYSSRSVFALALEGLSGDPFHIHPIFLQVLLELIEINLVRLASFKEILAKGMCVGQAEERAVYEAFGGRL